MCIHINMTLDFPRLSEQKLLTPKSTEQFEHSVLRAEQEFQELCTDTELIGALAKSCRIIWEKHTATLAVGAGILLIPELLATDESLVQTNSCGEQKLIADALTAELRNQLTESRRIADIEKDLNVLKKTGCYSTISIDSQIQEIKNSLKSHAQKLYLISVLFITEYHNLSSNDMAVKHYTQFISQQLSNIRLKNTNKMAYVADEIRQLSISHVYDSVPPENFMTANEIENS